MLIFGIGGGHILIDSTISIEGLLDISFCIINKSLLNIESLDNFENSFVDDTFEVFDVAGLDNGEGGSEMFAID